MDDDIVLDLVDEMQWEDIEELFISLEDAGLEDKCFDNVPACNVREYFDNES